ncbi:MAG: PilZ domain-containing protein, partial [Nitrospirae bacterium]|nr:PilZ domain-containing protein [Nitrospirota bacterium]
ARLTLPGEKKSQEVYITNVSRGGIGLYLNNAVKAGISLTLSFPFPDVSGEKENQTRTGTVVWCKRFGAVYAAGIKFDQPL